MKEANYDLKLFLSSKKINSRITKWGRILSDDFINRNPIFLGV